MPGYKDHLMGGAIAYSIFLYVLRNYCSSPHMAATWLLCALAGSLFPDVDVKSKGQKYFYFLVLGIILLLIFHEKFKTMALVSIFSLVPMLVKHRGIFHRLWFVIGLPITCWYSIAVYHPHMSTTIFFSAIFFIVGAISHLYLDLGLRRMFRI